MADTVKPTDLGDFTGDFEARPDGRNPDTWEVTAHLEAGNYPFAWGMDEPDALLVVNLLNAMRVVRSKGPSAMLSDPAFSHVSAEAPAWALLSLLVRDGSPLRIHHSELDRVASDFKLAVEVDSPDFVFTAKGV